MTVIAFALVLAVARLKAGGYQFDQQQGGGFPPSAELQAKHSP